MGAQLYAHAWGIDRSFLGNIPASKEKSIGNSQILPKTYTRRQEIEIVLSELADQVAARLRKQHYLTTCVSIYVGFASGYLDSKNKRSFHQQMKITATNSSKELIQAVLYLFQQNYTGQEVRHVGISYGQLSSNQNLQLNLFSPLEDIEKNEHLDEIVDRIRKKFGYQALVHATSVLEGGTAIERAGLVGGHAGGNEGLQ